MHLNRLTRVFITVPKYHVLAQMAICVLFIRTVNAVVRLHKQLKMAQMAIDLGNHQCVVSMCQKCSQCVVIKFLNKTKKKKSYFGCYYVYIYCSFVCLFVFVALRPKSTAMVIAGRSVHLTTLFPGQARTSG